MELVKARYKEEFGNEAIMVRAPGRINLIGEHTDYNNGFVFPAAVGQNIHFAIGKSKSLTECTLVSLDFEESFVFNLNEMSPLQGDYWQNFILGVVAEIQKSGRDISGFNLVFSGNVPRGSGMSSSAALECGTCFGLNELFQLGIPKLEMIKMSQMAEHNYAGVKCGIMDQFASMMGKKDQALQLDCQSLKYTYFPIKLTDHSLLLCNSNVTHSLANSQYNVRREECEKGVQILNNKYSEINSLRDASMDQLDSVKLEMTEVVYRRSKYIIEENQRVHDFSRALENSDFFRVGQILKTAHQAMRDDYEITCPEIDFMADFANQREDILGARMMGGGFGGCTLNLIKNGNESRFIVELNSAYQSEFSNQITPISIVISDGVSLVEI